MTIGEDGWRRLCSLLTARQIESILFLMRYRIGEIAERCQISQRTIRYYEEEGLIKARRSEGGQRFYSDEDIVYLKRIMELKSLGFSISEIRRIIELKKEDESGSKRRAELLSQYRQRLSADMVRLQAIQEHIDELEWRIKQLETADDFKSCPGALCSSCEYKSRCIFFKENPSDPQ